MSKSVITLTALWELLLDRFDIARVLVIAPKRVAEDTWPAEIAKWDHLKGLTCSLVLGTEKQRRAALGKKAMLYIINRENVAWLVENHRWDFDALVIDELSSFKSSKAQRFRALKKVRPLCRRVIGLTGTPAPNTLIDLWPQIYLLDMGKRLGRFVTHFREQYFLPDKRSAQQVFTYKPREGTEQAVRALLSDICISMQAKDYLTLPDMVEHDIPVVLDAPAARAYAKLERDMLLEVSPDETVLAGTAAVLTNKLLQLCNGAVYDDAHGVHEVHSCKIEAFLELVEQLNGQHALVFYTFQHDRERILTALARSGLRVRAFTGPRDADAWNAGQVDILLAHPASCAYGLNLQQGGHHIVWFGLNWSLELVLQANARLHRQGQREPVIVHRLIVQGGVDEDVVAALGDKDEVQQTLLRSLKARIEKVKGAAYV